LINFYKLWGVSRSFYALWWIIKLWWVLMKIKWTNTRWTSYENNQTMKVLFMIQHQVLYYKDVITLIEVAGVDESFFYDTTPSIILQGCYNVYWISMCRWTFFLSFSLCNVVIFYALHICMCLFFLSFFLSFLPLFPWFLSLHTFCCLDAQERVSIKGEGVPTITRYPNVQGKSMLNQTKDVLLYDTP
jgi:hypothetical protein